MLISTKGSYVYKWVKNKYLQLMLSSYTEYTAKNALENMLYNIFVTWYSKL